MKKLLLTGLFITSLLTLSACFASDQSGKQAAGMRRETSAGTDGKTEETNKEKTDKANAMEETKVASGETTAQASLNADSKSAYHKITAEEAKKMMDEGNITVVDVRTKDEYVQKHIPGALILPNETIEEEAEEALPDKDAVLLVHCRTGVRSRQASNKLVGLGYKNVYDFGGIVDWTYETESGEPKE